MAGLAIINVLIAVFILVFGGGVEGAASATVISQGFALFIYDEPIATLG